MKTAISIPDGIFHAADELAERLGMSRSELYARAVEAYVDQHRDEWITEKLNEVYKDNPSDLDPAWARAQSQAIGPEEW